MIHLGMPVWLYFNLEYIGMEFSTMFHSGIQSVLQVGLQADATYI